MAIDNKCGYVPNVLTLKRGERQQLVFWTDQMYEPSTPETTTKDYFLEAVNGADGNNLGNNDEDETILETTTSALADEDVTTVGTLEVTELEDYDISQELLDQA